MAEATTEMQGVPGWLTDVPPEEMRRIVDALYRIHQLTSVMTDLDRLLECIMEESKQVASAEACSLLLYDEETEELYFHTALSESGDMQALKRGVRLKLGQGIAGTAAQMRQSINVTDAREDKRAFRGADEITNMETRSLLAVPLEDKETLIGVLEVMNKVGGAAFSDFDQRIMETFSSLAASVIVSARLIETNLKSERLAAIGQTVAGLSHYIKNIVTGLTGSVDLIDESLEKKKTEILERCWPILKRSVGRISEVVEDMLAFSKPRTPIYRLCDVEEIFDDARATMGAKMEGKGVVMEIDTEGVAGKVKVEARGIHRCVLNLLSNAADAVTKGKGKILLRAATPVDEGLLIEVMDNGSGVPESIRENIFDPFFSTKGSGGTGLGLAVTHKIVLEHGGVIAIEESPWGGALFRITLPVDVEGG